MENFPGQLLKKVFVIKNVLGITHNQSAKLNVLKYRAKIFIGLKKINNYL